MLGQIKREKNTLLSLVALVFFQLSKRNHFLQFFLSIPRSIRLHLSFKLYLFQLSLGLYFRSFFCMQEGIVSFSSFALLFTPRNIHFSFISCLLFPFYITSTLLFFHMIRTNCRHLSSSTPSSQSMPTFSDRLFFLLIRSNLFHYKVLPSVSTSQGQRQRCMTLGL